ncbi:uncharacterized protein EI90DRAFT_3037034, partial [Cantharellus anzutake]|uniref:uncharacterized protein n=1 Tax=Cantharellus anzutake TaxID=1750568 RepID=UPI0019050EA1
STLFRSSRAILTQITLWRRPVQRVRSAGGIRIGGGGSSLYRDYGFTPPRALHVHVHVPCRSLRHYITDMRRCTNYCFICDRPDVSHACAARLAAAAWVCLWMIISASGRSLSGLFKLCSSQHSRSSLCMELTRFLRLCVCVWCWGVYQKPPYINLVNTCPLNVSP